MLAIEISSRPLKWEFEIEPAQLKARQADNPSARYDFKQSAMEIHSQDIKVKLDGTQLRASLDMRGMTDFWLEAGRKGREGAQAATRDSVEFGNQIAHIEDGVTIAQVIQQRMMEQPETYTFFIPSPYNISWQPNEQTIDYEPADVSFDWQIEKNVMDYVPGSFSINILQRPEVEIKYVGSPIYVPPSSAPDFEASA